MEFYQINDLERLSGIKAHTIRIWEKRYEIISPYRTETNIRYYDDAQLKKLLNIAGLIGMGYKISKIALMSDEDIHQLIKNKQEGNWEDGTNTLLINTMINSMLDFDEVAFENAFERCLRKKGVLDTFLHVVYPFLHKTGVLWSVDETMPVQEHFASNLVRRKLHVLTESLKTVDAQQSTFLLFLPAGEWHEIGLLLANYLVRLHGHPSIYLGQNVPHEELDDVLRKTGAKRLLSFVISDHHEEYIVALQAKLKLHFKSVQLFLSGPITRLSRIKTDKQSLLLYEVEDLLKFL